METISRILINGIGTGYLKSRLEAYAIVPLFERAQKKILPEGGDARFFASRPLRQDHGSGSGALEGGVSRSFFIGAYFFNNSLRATSSAVSAPIR